MLGVYYGKVVEGGAVVYPTYFSGMSYMGLWSACIRSFTACAESSYNDMRVMVSLCGYNTTVSLMHSSLILGTNTILFLY